MIDYTLLAVSSSAYRNDEERNIFVIMGDFQYIDKDETTHNINKRIGVVDLDNCNLIYDNIDCPEIAKQHEMVLKEASDLLIAYYYKKSKELAIILDNSNQFINELIEKNVSFFNIPIFDYQAKKEANKHNKALSKAINSAKESLGNINNNIILYIYTTIYNKLCKRDAELFSKAIGATMEESKTHYKFSSELGIEFSIGK